MVGRAPRVTIYEGKDKQWYWRLIASNNEQVAQGEGHTNRYDAERAAVTALRNFQEAEFHHDGD